MAQLCVIVICVRVPITCTTMHTLVNNGDAYLRQWSESSLVQVSHYYLNRWWIIVIWTFWEQSVGLMNTNPKRATFRSRKYFTISFVNWRLLCWGLDVLKHLNRTLATQIHMTIWRNRSWSTLDKVMACCLTAPSYYLNQCRLFIIGCLAFTWEQCHNEA